MSDTLEFDLEMSEGDRRVFVPSDALSWHVFHETVCGREYPFFDCREETPTRIVDIGAGIGAATLFFRRVYPRTAVHAFEPSPSSRTFLERNVAGMAGVTVHPFGLHRADLHTKLFRGKDGSAQSSVFRGSETIEDFEAIELRRASTAVDATGGLDGAILKVDTEGCEVDILEDLGPRISGALLGHFEYHSEADRRRIDEVFRASHVMTFAKATCAHRGVVTYVSNRFIDRHPALSTLRIDRHLPESVQ